MHLLNELCLIDVCLCMCVCVCVWERKGPLYFALLRVWNLVSEKLKTRAPPSAEKRLCISPLSDFKPWIHSFQAPALTRKASRLYEFQPHVTRVETSPLSSFKPTCQLTASLIHFSKWRFYLPGPVPATELLQKGKQDFCPSMLPCS